MSIMYKLVSQIHNLVSSLLLSFILLLFIQAIPNWLSEILSKIKFD